MSDLKAIVVATVHGANLSLHDLLHALKLKGQLPELIAAAVVDKVIADTAKDKGITVSDAELQQAADAFRLRGGLNKAADTQRWLAQHRLAPADLEERLERDLVRQKLVADIPRDQVAKYFAENRARFDRARLRQIVVDKEGIAQELLSRILEEDAEFGDLARRHSLDPQTRASGGDLGIVSRAALPPVVSAAVFTAKNGDVVGPVNPNGAYLLIKVEEIVLGQLDAPTTAAIQEVLFRDWIARQVHNGKIEMKLEV
jgi:parvulin-like peptidyl-prolyl isomerase